MSGCLARTRMCKDSPEHQALTLPNAQITPQDSDAKRQELPQIITAWSNLSAPLKAAILAIVQSSTISETQCGSPDTKTRSTKQRPKAFKPVFTHLRVFASRSANHRKFR